MNWKKLLTSPPPTTGWLLDGETVAAVRRDPKGQLHCGAAAMPTGALEVGPIGLQAVDEERLTEALRQVHLTAGGAKRAAVVIPTAWVRCHLLDFDELPRRRSEVDDVLRWRLKRLLPVAPGDMRISWVASGIRDGRRRLLTITGVDRAFTNLENCFAEVGVDPGLITPRVLALVSADSGAAAPRLTIQQEVGFLSTSLVLNGTVHMLRTKPLPASVSAWDGARGELHLALTYLRESLAVQGPLEVMVVAESPEAEEELIGWWAGQDEVSVRPVPPLQPCLEPGLAERLGAARLAPVYTVLLGEQG